MVHRNAKKKKKKKKEVTTDVRDSKFVSSSTMILEVLAIVFFKFSCIVCPPEDEGTLALCIGRNHSHPKHHMAEDRNFRQPYFT